MRVSRCFAVASLLCWPTSLFCQTAVQFQTDVGNINVNLFPAAAPQTVANFLIYVNSGAYNNSFIHRSVPGFIIQGGGYTFIDGAVQTIAAGPTVPNEYSIPNTQGTIAMALLSGDPNSATDEWFFNLVDNSATLDDASSGSGPFTVFGQIADSASLAVMSAIGNLSVFDGSSVNAALSNLPLIGNPSAITAQDLVLINAIVPITLPEINTGGVISASGFGAFSSAAPGSFCEIYGTNLAGTTRGWGPSDFVNGAAPTSLDNVSVKVNNQSAYVLYVSPDLVNIQIPSTIPTGSASVTVTYQGEASQPIDIDVNAVEGGLLAPASFNVGGTQYVEAVHASTGALVSSGNVPDIPAAPAIPGETLVIYGIGFGPVTPSSVPIAGQIVTGTSTLANPVQITIGGIPAVIAYQGLAPSEVGLYQFNVTVPMDAASGDVPLQVSQAGTANPQNLFLSVQ